MDSRESNTGFADSAFSKSRQSRQSCPWWTANASARNLFRVVLSHSRKGYSDVVWRQTTECFIRCLENSFRHFGRVPRTLVIDYVPRHIINVLFPTAICALLAETNGPEDQISRFNPSKWFQSFISAMRISIAVAHTREIFRR